MDNRFDMFKRNAGQSAARSVQSAPQQTARSFSANQSSQQRSFGLGSSFAQKPRGLAVTRKKGGCRSCRGAV